MSKGLILLKTHLSKIFVVIYSVLAALLIYSLTQTVSGAVAYVTFHAFDTPWQSSRFEGLHKVGASLSCVFLPPPQTQNTTTHNIQTLNSSGPLTLTLNPRGLSWPYAFIPVCSSSTCGGLSSRTGGLCVLGLRGLVCIGRPISNANRLMLLLALADEC